MTTPTYKTLASALQEVRFYTEKDPYYYTIDNRPLQDLDYNINQLLSVSDASRRATMTEALVDATINQALFGLGPTRTLGLEAFEVSEGIVALTPGVLLVTLPINEGTSDNILKRGSYPTSLNLQVPGPNLIDHEITYLIQARYVDGNTGQATFYEDLTNSFLASSLLDGKAEVSVLAGAEAIIGSSVAPDPTAGWFPLYTVTRTYGSALSLIQRHASAPAMATIHTNLIPVELSSMAELGAVDLSSGVYPTVPNSSAIWKVSVGGTVAGTTFVAGDLLVYSKTLTSFYRVKTTDTVTSVNGNVGDVVLDKASVGLSQVDDTSDLNKPVSTAQQAALDNKVDKVVGKGLSTEDYTTAEKTKLAGVQAGATANSTDAQLRDRTTHTGVQAISTVDGLQTALDGKQASNTNLTALAGLTGAADRLPYFTGVGALSLATLTAAARNLLAATDQVGQRNVLGLGTSSVYNIQTSPYDTTANRLLTVGAFGLGSTDLADTSADLNTIYATGFYIASGANQPPGMGACLLIVLTNAQNYSVQIAVGQGVPELWVRTCLAGSWSAWTKQFSTFNVSPFIQTLLDDADAATARTTLGAVDASTVNQGAVANTIVQRNSVGSIYCNELWFGQGKISNHDGYGNGSIQFGLTGGTMVAPYGVEFQSNYDSGASWEINGYTGTPGGVANLATYRLFGDAVGGSLTWGGATVLTTANIGNIGATTYMVSQAVTATNFMDFSIPSWAREIVISFEAVKQTGAAHYYVQINGITSGYFSRSTQINDYYMTPTTGWGWPNNSAANVMTGLMTIVRGTYNYTSSLNSTLESGGYWQIGQGRLALTDAPTTIRVQVGGTAVFASGWITVTARG